MAESITTMKTTDYNRMLNDVSFIIKENEGKLNFNLVHDDGELETVFVTDEPENGRYTLTNVTEAGLKLISKYRTADRTVHYL